MCSNPEKKGEGGGTVTQDKGTKRRKKSQSLERTGKMVQKGEAIGKKGKISHFGKKKLKSTNPYHKKVIRV